MAFTMSRSEMVNCSRLGIASVNAYKNDVSLIDVSLALTLMGTSFSLSEGPNYSTSTENNNCNLCQVEMVTNVYYVSLCTMPLPRSS